MNENPLVSIIIPTYNRRHCLGRAIDSVLNQDHGSVEIIVVDDASPDGTADWVAEAYPQVRLIRNPVNRGVAAARNAGLAAGRGEFIAFLDDDDWWDASFLRRQLDLLASRADAVLSYCNFTSVAEDGTSPVLGNARALGPDPVGDFLMGNPIPSLTLALMRREAVQDAGGFREDYRMCEDREFYLRLLRRGAIVYESGQLALKTRSKDSMTVNVKLWVKWTQTLLDEFFSQTESAPYRHMEKQARARWKMRLALGCFRQPGTLPMGLRLAASALRLDAGGALRYMRDRAVYRLNRSKTD